MPNKYCTRVVNTLTDKTDCTRVVNKLTDKTDCSNSTIQQITSTGDSLSSCRYVDLKDNFSSDGSQALSNIKDTINNPKISNISSISNAEIPKETMESPGCKTNSEQSRQMTTDSYTSKAIGINLIKFCEFILMVIVGAICFIILSTVLVCLLCIAIALIMVK
jgi:hypothetical protein